MAITINANANLTAWEDISTTSQAMPAATTGKTMTVSAGKNFLAADTVQLTATAAVIPTGIIGTVTSYSGTSLVVAPNNSVAASATLCGVYGLIWSKATVTNGTGAKTFPVSFNPYKVNASALISGLAIRVHSRVAPFTNFMVGTVTSYTASTGNLVLNITSATGSASISDWVICQDGTFTAWDVSPQWGDTLTINGTSQLSITQTPKMNFKFSNATTNGQIRVTNSSTSTMLLVYGNEPTGANSPNNTGLRFESNALFYTQGSFIIIGTATGAANETFAIPAGIDYPSYVEVETGVATGIYEPYKIGPISYHDLLQNVMIVRKTEITPFGGEASKWLFYNPATRNIESGDGSTGGITLTSGVRVRIPNIHISCDQCSPNVIIAGTGAQDQTIAASIATGAGAKSFTVATGLSYVATDNALLEYPGAPGVYLTGTITAYTSGTGAMTFTATGSQGTYTGTGWVLRDQRGPLTVADWSANSSTTTTNGRLYTSGEVLSTATRVNGGFTGIGRNNQKQWSLPSVIAAGSLLWYHSDAPGSYGNSSRRWQIDTAPSGTVYMENCSTHFLSLDLIDYSALTLLRVGAEHIYLRSSLGSTTINRLSSVAVSSVKQYHGFKSSSLIGATSIQNLLTWTDAPDASGGAVTCMSVVNAANVIAWNNVQAYNTTRQRGFSVIQLDTITFAAGVTPTNTYIIGNASLAGLAGQEWEGFYVANRADGTVGAVNEAATQHISLSRCTNLVIRKVRPLGTMKICSNQVFSGDAFSYNITLHDGDFTANNNATSVVGMLSNAGTSNIIIANWKMGTVAAGFVSTLNRSSSGLVERNVTFRNILATNPCGYTDGAGTPYSNGMIVEKLSGGSSYMRTSPVANPSNPSYKDTANFYTYIDPSAATGRLSIGTFSGQDQLPLYDITGATYVNNAGLIYFENAADSVVIKGQNAIRGITSFANVEPVVLDSRNSYTSSVTSNTIGTGSKSFTVGSGLALIAGDTIAIWYSADVSNYMSGTITSYSSTNLVVNITTAIGSGTFASWNIKSRYQTEATYEFRTCTWGADITAQSWVTLTGSNLAAVTIADSNVGINMQVRVTGNGVLVGRYLQQILIPTNNNSSFNPSVTTFNITATNVQPGSLYALYDTTSGTNLIGSVTTGTTGIIVAPGLLYGVTVPTLLRVRKYGCQPVALPSSYYNAPVSVNCAQTIDAGITVSYSATVAGYTDLSDTVKLYDYCQYYFTSDISIASQLCTKNGTQLNFGSYNLVFDNTAGSVFSLVGNTITVKAGNIINGSIITTGTVTYLNGAAAQIPITSSAGTTGVITLTVPSGSSVVVYKTDGSRDQYVASSGTTITSYVPAGVTGARTYKVTKYGYNTVAGSVVVTGGGLFSATITATVDTGITQATVGTVAAYTTLENLDKLYDYAAYYETTSIGIDYSKLANKVATTVDLLSKTLTIDAAASTVFGYNGTTTITIKASVLFDGVAFTSLTTTGTVIYSNGALFNTIITSGAGTTGKLTITGLSGHNVYVQDATPIQQDYQTGASSYVLWISAGATGTWRWRAVKYGNSPETGTFTATGGGRFTATLSNIADTNISQVTLATVLAYTALDTWDKFYDYCQAYLTTSSGKALGQFATSNGAAVNIGSYALTVDATAGSVFALASGITIKASVMSAGVIFGGAETTTTISVANGAIINTWYTSSAGRSVVIVAPNIISGSRFQLWNSTGNVEIANNLATASGVYYRLIWTSNITVRLRVTYQSGTTSKNEVLSTSVLTNTGLTFLDSQTDDLVYINNVIDGSAITEFSTDYAHVFIDVSDPDGVTNVQRIYAWYHYIITTADGIRNFFEGMEASDSANYTIMAGTLNLKLFNTNTAPVIITGGYLSRSDGTTVIAATSNSIQMDPAKAYVAASTSSGATLAQIEGSTVIAKEATAQTIKTNVLSIPTNPLLTSDTRLNNIDASISSRLATSGYTTPPTAAVNASAVRTELTTELGRIDAAVSSRNAVAPDNTSIAAIKAKTDTLVNGPTLEAIEASAILAKQASLVTINDGVKKASLFIPHTQSL